MNHASRTIHRTVISVLRKGAFGAVLAALAGLASAQDEQGLSEILNYRQYTPLFSSAGQPSREQLPLIKQQVYQQIQL